MLAVRGAAAQTSSAFASLLDNRSCVWIALLMHQVEVSEDLHLSKLGPLASIVPAQNPPNQSGMLGGTPAQQGLQLRLTRGCPTGVHKQLAGSVCL